jgi:hypothetical protein
MPSWRNKHRRSFGSPDGGQGCFREINQQQWAVPMQSEQPNPYHPLLCPRDSIKHCSSMRPASRKLSGVEFETAFSGWDLVLLLPSAWT